MMSQVLVIIANFLIASVLALYFIQVYKGASRPNIITWLIWFVALGMNTISYFFVIQKDLLKTMFPLISLIGIGIILVYAIIKGKIGKFAISDIIALILCSMVGIYWYLNKNPIISNLLMQVILLIGYVPTLNSLLKKRSYESPLPWNMAVAAYAVLIISIIISKEFTWTALAYPFVNGIIGNGSIALISNIQKKSH